MKHLNRDLCQIIIYPQYQDWIAGNGTILSNQMLSNSDLKSEQTLKQKAMKIVRLNDYYCCIVRYRCTPIFQYIK